MGYMLLYEIQGSESVSDPYIRRGAHPPPHRLRPRVPAKLTHNLAMGFPWRPCRGSLLGRHLLRSEPGCDSWLYSVIGHSCVSHWAHTYTCKPLVVNSSVVSFPVNYALGEGIDLRRGMKIQLLHLMNSHIRRTRGWMEFGDNYTPNKGSVTWKFLEILVIKFKNRGFNVVVGRFL